MAEPDVPIASTEPVTVLSTDEVVARLAGRGQPCWLVHGTDRLAFRDGHIPGALAVQDDGVLLQLAASATLIVYGEDEHAATAPRLVVALRNRDAEVAWYAGGLAAWRRAGLPVERSG
jgi:3-mercaptopyruvate sulfurtransferase SseA